MYLSNKNGELKSTKLFKEGDGYFLELRYEVEDDYGIHEVIIPKMELPIWTKQIPSIECVNDCPSFSKLLRTQYAVFGDHKFRLYCKDIEVKTISGNDVVMNTLKILLKSSKKESKLSCKQIAKILNKPITLVEHWFRTDSCFAIPDNDIWMDLKKLLNIDTDIFDESIMTFEQKYGSYEKSERCYLCHGISPTLTCDGKIKIIV